MKIKKITFVYMLLIAMVMLASCGPTEPASDKGADSGLKAWFDAPLPNSVFVPPNPITLVMHASDTQGITSFGAAVVGEYAYVYGDLKRIAILAGAFFAILIVLSFVI